MYDQIVWLDESTQHKGIGLGMGGYAGMGSPMAADRPYTERDAIREGRKVFRALCKFRDGTIVLFERVWRYEYLDTVFYMDTAEAVATTLKE